MAANGAELDPKQFAALMKAIKEFDPNLAKELRKELRGVGKTLVAAIKARIMEAPPTGGVSRGRHDSRAQIAAGTTTRIATSKAREGLFIATSSGKLPAERKPFMRAYNKKSFRHRVFGNPQAWVVQQGRPYFGDGTNEARDAAAAGVEAALNAAIEQMGN